MSRSTDGTRHYRDTQRAKASPRDVTARASNFGVKRSAVELGRQEKETIESPICCWKISGSAICTEPLALEIGTLNLGATPERNPGGRTNVTNSRPGELLVYNIYCREDYPEYHRYSY
ncbi:unnamed protein product [Echinostoma caproni]|uniref:Uncharacterized protein n=1 Tax=Echinostoma caproni TaxID=27848 RepID=A0A183BGR6_9TREM|nr:unnamed protein product [Echinostoma caproni]